MPFPFAQNCSGAVPKNIAKLLDFQRSSMVVFDVWVSENQELFFLFYRIIHNIVPDAYFFLFITDDTIVEAGLPGEIRFEGTNLFCANGFELADNRSQRTCRTTEWSMSTMLCRDARIVRLSRQLSPVTNTKNPMHVIRHDNMSIQENMRKMTRYFIPAGVYNISDIR